jgi:cytochrome c-type biogenesis protein CcmH
MKVWKTVTWLLLLPSVLYAYAPQQPGADPLSPELEVRVHALGKELRCPICQGLSIADSPSSMARGQMDKVRELITQGKSDDEIREYFVARYGEWVLMEPARKGAGWLVWLAPFAVILLGAVLVVSQLKRKKSSPPPVSPSAPAPVASSGDAYLDAIRREVDQ